MSSTQLITRAKLLDAAIATFSAHGYAGTPVSRIAQHAGVNVSLINRYFGGKLGLLKEVLDLAVQAMTWQELPYPAQHDLRSEVFHYLMYRIDHAQRHKSLIHVLSSQMLVDPALATAHADLFAKDHALHARLKQATYMPERASLKKITRELTSRAFSLSMLGLHILDQDLDEQETQALSFSQIFATGVMARYA